MRKPESPPNTVDLYKEPATWEAFKQEGEVRRYAEVARLIETRYHHWKQVRFLARSHDLDPKALWLMVKMSRQPSYRTLPLTGFGGVPLKYNSPDVLQEELMHIDQQLAGRFTSSDEHPISAAHQEKFIISALREEAIASSMLEGAATTRRDAKDMLVSGRKPRTVGERMVVNNYQAISFIRQHRNEPLTPEFLLEVQSILTDKTLENKDECGRFRNDDDIVNVVDRDGEILHTPPPANELKGRLNALCNFANGTTEIGFVHPVIRASVLHFQIGFDHPFCDGNGRSARALFYWAMLKAGYWLFEYLPISRLIYASPSKYGMAYLYSETDDFDVTYFLAYKARVIRQARKELSQYIARKQTEMAEARKIFESDRMLNHRQRDVVVRMMRHADNALTIQEHQARHNISYATARSDLLDLVQWEYLAKFQVGNRFDFIKGAKLLDV